MNAQRAKRIWDDHWVKFAISFLLGTVIVGFSAYKVDRLDAADDACASVAREAQLCADKNSERIGKVEVVIPRIDDDVRETKQDVKEMKRDVSELKEMVGIILERTK